MRKGEGKGSYPGLWEHPRTGIYWLRIAVPKAAQAALSQTMIQRTLETRDRNLAIERWGAANAEWRAKIRAATSGDLRLINDDTARAIADGLMAGAAVGHDEGNDYASRDALSRAEIAELVEADLARMDGVGSEEGGWIEFGEFTKADREAIVTALIDQRLSMFVNLLHRTQAEAAHYAGKIKTVGSSPAIIPEGKRLLDAWLDWSKEGQPGQQTAGEYKMACGEFIAVNGNLPLGEYKPEHFVAYKRWLQDQDLAQSSRNKRVTGLRSIFNVAVNNLEIPANPGAGMKMPKAKPSNARKLGILDNEIRLLFASPIYTKNERPRGGAGECAYWLPILSLYTGARQGELAQLRVNDLIVVEGVKCMAIRDDGEGASDSPFVASLKTNDSYRVIPLPKRLIDLGFLDFVAWVGDGSLFPKLKPNRYGKHAPNWSKWYNRSRRAWGITRKWADFHCIRHAVKTRLRNADGDHEAKLKLVGHSSGSASEDYGSVSPKAMKKLIDQIDYDVTIPKWKPPQPVRKAA